MEFSLVFYAILDPLCASESRHWSGEPCSADAAVQQMGSAAHSPAGQTLVFMDL
jgi:hypothetical protein